MKPIFVVLILFFFSLISYSQSNPKLDSLKKVLASLPKEGSSFASDTTRVRVLCEMGRTEIIDSLAKDYFDISIDLAKKINYSRLEYNSVYWLGRHYKKNGLFFEAISKLYEALFIAEKLNDERLKAICLTNIADSHTWIDENKKSIPFYDKALNIFMRLGEFEDYIDCLNNKALAYYGLKDYDKAIELFMQCMKYEKYVKGKLSEASYLSNLGSCYGKKKDYDKSIIFFKKALNVYQKLGKTYEDHLAITKAEMAKTFYDHGDYKRAIAEAKAALLFNNRYFGANLLANKVLYESYNMLGDKRQAYGFLENYIVAKESTEKQDKEKRLASLKFQYDNQRKEADILNLNTERKFLIGGIIVFICFTLLQGWNFIRLNKKNKLIEQQKDNISRIKDELQELNQSLELRVEERTIELKMANEELIKKNKEISEALFKGQSIERKRVAVELHDNLGAAISGIKWRLQAINSENLSEKEKKIYEGIKNMMDDTYTEVRLISHNMLPAELEMFGLIRAIEKLITDLNKTDKINFFFKSEFEKLNIEKKAELELYSICLELVNNILKHSEAKHAYIRFFEKNNQIILEIEDDGKGIDLKKTNGMGLKNMQSRIESISGKFMIEYEKGTKFIMKIPYLGRE